MRIPLDTEEASRHLGQRLAKILRPGDLLALQGNLGTGKTFIARAIIQSLANAMIDVPSPTFVLAAPYDLPAFPLVHYDLYRLDSPQDIDELGLEDALDHGVALVEWPELLEDHLRRSAIWLRLSDDTESRTAEIEGPPDFQERFNAN